MLLAGCLAIGALSATPVSAHVKWFEAAEHYPLRVDLIWSDRTLLWLASSVVAVLGLSLVQRVVSLRKWPWDRALEQMTYGARTILAIQAAIGLVASAVQQAVLAPNLVLPSGVVGLVVPLVQLFIAVSFVTGLFDWLGGLVLLSLIGFVGVWFSPMDALEQMFWAGVAVAMVVIGRGSIGTGLARPWFHRRNPGWARRAIVVLRVATGFSLIVVALTEKLWNPDLGRAFLVARPELNVFPSLPGLAWLSNDMFVLCAGLTEAAIGAMLISGISPRLVILSMWLPFNVGIAVLPSQELLGHLPILGIMYVLLVSGTDAVRVPATREPRILATTPPVRVRHQIREEVHGGIAASRIRSRATHPTQIGGHERLRELAESGR
jgi:hypothetical protein